MTAAHRTTVDHETKARVLDVLRLRPAGLFTDIDGTISPIAPTPSEAVVPAAAKSALHSLASRLAVVGAVTGRAATDGARMLGVPEIYVIGNHGMEWLREGERWVNPRAEASMPDLMAALEEVAAAVTRAGVQEGVVPEDKQLTASIHYRLSPDPLAARDAILAAAQSSAARHGLRVTEGRFVVEMRPNVVINKGRRLLS